MQLIEMEFYGSTGLVGGHCIGVDPYYLVDYARSVGYNPEIIQSGRRINDGMSIWLSKELILRSLRSNLHSSQKDILIVGLSFKANCSDLRNSKVFDSIKFFLNHSYRVFAFDPFCSPESINKHILSHPSLIVFNDFSDIADQFDGLFKLSLISCVHDKYSDDYMNFSNYLSEDCLGFDLPCCLDASSFPLMTRL